MDETPRTELDVSMTINGTASAATVPARTLLSEYLREVEHLTGTHRGCETAKCGACTVLLDDATVKSCNVLAAQADGKAVVTVEGLATDGRLSPVQRAFLDNHGMQCGYCTPGFVVTATDLLERTPDPSPDEIRRALDGHICRCTGYVDIVESIQAAAEARGGRSAGDGR